MWRYWSVYRQCKSILDEVLAAPDRWTYTDLAIAPPRDDEFEALDLYHATAGGEPLAASNVTTPPEQQARSHLAGSRIQHGRLIGPEQGCMLLAMRRSDRIIGGQVAYPGELRQRAQIQGHHGVHVNGSFHVTPWEGQTRPSRYVCVTSGLPLIADMRRTDLDVGFVPIAT